MRRATLRGEENLTKRHQIAAARFNLSLLRVLCSGWEPQNNGSLALDAFFRLFSLAFTGKLRACAALSLGPGRSSFFFLIFSESQPLHENHGFFNSLLGMRTSVRLPYAIAYRSGKASLAEPWLQARGIP